MSLTEIELDREFALALAGSPDLVRFLVSRTRFASLADEARLLHDELRAARTAPYWWKHRWCAVPGWGESETDIFTVFEAARAGHRLAVHIENKKAGGKFTPRQPEMYRARAAHMMTLPRCPRHSASATVLMAPRSFLPAQLMEAEKFDACISYEEVANYVPAFRM